MRMVAMTAVLTLAAAPGGGVRMLGGPELVWGKTPLGMARATALRSGEDGGPLYVLRVRYAAGERSPLHSHPDARVVTVLSGTIAVGSGAATRPLRAGDTILIPAGAPHYGWARTGPAELQEVGSGPTGTTILSGS